MLALTRRRFLAGSAGCASVAVLGATATGGGLPRRDNIKVAFLLGDGTNVIDMAGPWEVFQDTAVGEGFKARDPFELFTVAPTTDLISMTGGLKVKPTYSLDDAPAPQVIVVPAQRSAKPSLAWLARTSAQTDVTMSVCTGAFQLARAGLLKGVTATTHHEYWDKLASEFPDVNVKRGVRFVDNGRIATAGGLTSGIDMALHIVARYFDAEVAATTARYMEHTSEAWRDGLRASRPAYRTPL
jgi:transcriptional regulator GlxA family with amidase domain